MPHSLIRIQPVEIFDKIQMPYLTEELSQAKQYNNAGLSLSQSPSASLAGYDVMENEDEQFYTRCRRAILLLNAQLVKAAEERSEFAPFLLEAMGNAMSELLEYGDERNLLLLEQWLDEENQ